MAEQPPFAHFNNAMSLLNHLYFNPILETLVRAGVPDHLDKGQLPASELARLAGLDALSLTRVLRALAAFGAFEEVSPGVFANNAVSGIFCNRPGGLRNYALFIGSDFVRRSAAALGHSVATGGSATTHVTGESFWDHMRRHPEENEIFNRALAELRGDEHRQIADAYDWAGVKTVVDIGGGVGSLLAAILEKRPAVRGILIDQPEVLPAAERLLTERGVSERCRLLAGSFFDPISAEGEVWAMSQVLHDWPDAECRAILQRCREAMRAADRLIVIEMVTVPCEPNLQVGMIDMHMLMYFGQARQRTVDEYKELFESAQFALSRVLRTAGSFSIVEARPV